MNSAKTRVALSAPAVLLAMMFALPSAAGATPFAFSTGNPDWRSLLR